MLKPQLQTYTNIKGDTKVVALRTTDTHGPSQNSQKESSGYVRQSLHKGYKLKVSLLHKCLKC